MFERFTQPARRTVFVARSEACRLGSPRIETEHLLLGMIEDVGLSRFLLEPAEPADIGAQIASGAPLRQALPANTDLPLSIEAKQVLRRAEREADSLRDREIGNEHLLLGLVLGDDHYAVQVLAQNGITPEVVRKRIAALREDPSLVPDPGDI